MELYLLDLDLNIVDVIENYKSIIWTTRYFSSGDFELYIPATEKMINLLKKDYYITRDDDFTQAMIIENVQITTSIEEGNYLIITGKNLKSILNRRIIWQQTSLNGSVVKAINQLVYNNAIEPIIPERKIKRLKLGAEISVRDTINTQYTGDNLGETIESICRTYGLGYDILLDIEDKSFIFVIYKGNDRSYKQNNNPYVVFSNEYENLLSTNYANNSENYKNVALVAGEGEGIDRKTVVVGKESDLKRYELYVDARDISSNENEIDEENYNELLSTRGKEKLEECNIIESIEGEVESGYTYKLNEDYFLGDIVEVINEYGIEMTPRVTEIIESIDDTGQYIIPTFSTSDTDMEA